MSPGTPALYPGGTPVSGRVGAAAAAVLLLAICAGPARAGQWIQVSCANPDGSAAPSQGWLTTARTAVVTHLPKRGRIALACTGPSCPKIKVVAFTGAQRAALVQELLHLTFHRGDVLTLTATEPGRRAEVITLRFRLQRKPFAREAK